MFIIKINVCVYQGCQLLKVAREDILYKFKIGPPFNFFMLV